MSSKLSRLDFLRFSALGASALILPRSVSAAMAPKKAKKGDVNDQINIGFIGLGQQAIYLMSGFITIPNVRIVAGCDVYDIKRDRFQSRVNKYYADNGIKNKLDMYIRYEEVLARYRYARPPACHHRHRRVPCGQGRISREAPDVHDL